MKFRVSMPATVIGFGLTLCLSLSCSSTDQAYFPMKQGQRWTYQILGDFDERVDDVVVVGRANVGKVKGWELQGKLGTSRLGWDGGTLVASELGGRGFDPPLPIFSTSVKSWRGLMTYAGKSIPVSATVASHKTVEKLGGRDYPAVQTTVLLVGTNKPIQLDSWFVSGIGLLRQEQRTGDHRDRRIEYLSGPVNR